MHRGAVAQVEDELHRAFAKGFAANERGSLAIAECAGDDLRGAGRAAVDEDNQRLVGGQCFVGGVVDDLALFLALQVEHRAAVEEVVGHVHGRVAQAAAVLAQVEYQARRPLRQQVLQRRANFVAALAAEARQGDVADGRVGLQQPVGHRRQQDVGADDADIDRLGRVGMTHSQSNGCALLALDQIDDPRHGHRGGDRPTIDRQQYVAGQDAGRLGGVAGDRLQSDLARFLRARDVRADAAEGALQPLALHVAGGRLDEDGVGVVKRGQRAADGPIGHLSGLRQRAQEVPLDERPGLLEQSGFLIRLGVGQRGVVAAVDKLAGQEAGSKGAGSQDHEHEDGQSTAKTVGHKCARVTKRE